MPDGSTRTRMPIPHGRYARLFRSREAALEAGMWTRATILRDGEAMRWCRAHGVPIVKAAGEGTDSAGGFLVPDSMAETIYALREQRGVFRRYAELAPMGSDYQQWPRRTGGFTASWTDEGAAITESSFTGDSFTLTAKKLAVLGRVSAELDEDAGPDLAGFIAQEIGYSFADKEDECGFNGDGSQSYRGITGVIAKALDGSHAAVRVVGGSGHDTFGELDAGDFTNLMGSVMASAIPGACWYISQVGYALSMFRLGAVSGGDLTVDDAMLPPLLDAMPVGFASAMPMRRLRTTYLGYPVVLTQVLPQVATTLSNKVMCLFGDLSLAATLGERRQVSIRSTRNRALETDEIMIRGTERIDVVAHDLGSNSDRGPLGVLVGA